MFELLSIHWNVNPVLVHIGSLEIRWYSLLFISGFILGWYIFRWFFRREGISEKLLDPLLYTLLICTIVGARLGHCLFYQPDYYLAPFIDMFGGKVSPEIAEHGLTNWQAFWEMFMPWKGGLASHGGTIALVLGMIWFSKHYGPIFKFDFMWMADHLCIAIAFAACFIRLGNLFNSEIYGDVTSLPWGVIFDRRQETLPKHPTQLYEALAYLLLGLFLIWRYRHRLGSTFKGFFFGAFFLGCFGMRFLIEFIKEPQVEFETGMIERAGLNMGQWLSVPFIIAGVLILIYSYRKKTPATIVK